MKACRRKVLCVDCPDRKSCPQSVRRDKRARRPMADSASPALLRRAAAVLESGWYSCKALGIALYGEPGPGKKERMANMVKARRPVNKLRKMGVLAVRAGSGRVAEYTLLPGWREVLE